MQMNLLTKSCLALSLAATGFGSQLAHAADEVSLSFARSYVDSAVRTDGFVEVENLAYEKSVNIVFQNNLGEWKVSPATYFFDAGNNHEIWNFHIPGEVVTEFSVSYDVNGQTFWDNNQGQNYHLDQYVNDAIVVDDLNDAQGAISVDAAGNSSINGNILVKNISYYKEITVIYTDDNWATIKTAAAYYDSTTSSGTEKWAYSLPIANGADNADIEIAFEYKHDNGTTWDNNYGSNYHVRYGIIWR